MGAAIYIYETVFAMFVHRLIGKESEETNAGTKPRIVK